MIQMLASRTFGARGFAALALMALASCGPAGEGPPALQTVEVTGGQQRYVVDFVDQGGGLRHIVVSSLGYRQMDRAEGELAFRMAAQAAEVVSCANGQGVRVLPETRVFQETDRSQGALSRGGAIWQFKGRCG
ncbi:MAG: hypothetical protein AAFR17_12030 [Pseudomonadota bacterium]